MSEENIKTEAVGVESDTQASAEVKRGGFKGFIDNHREIWTFVKFALAAASSSVVQMLVYYLLYKFAFTSFAGKAVDNPVLKLLGFDDAMDAALAGLISVAVGYAVAYIINRKVTFNSSSNIVRSVIIYILMVLVTMVVTTWISAKMTVLMMGWPSCVAADGSLKSIPTLIVSLVGMLVPTAYTYPLQRFVINPPRKDKKEEEAAEEAVAEEAAE